MPVLRRQLVALLATTVTAAMLVGPALPAAHAHSAKAPVELSFWTWAPGIQSAIDLFNSTHSDIHVTQTYNAGPPTIYSKYFTVLKAGKGAPDVGAVEYDWLPSFEYLGNGGLVDMGKYGANRVKNQFASGVWSQVSVGTSVYAIPQDAGPMGMYYRKDLFAKYHIAVPKTWAQYAAAAAALHKADPNLYINNFSSTSGDFALWAALMWQGGGTWFSSTGDAWKVSLNSAANKKVLNYWGGLATAGLLKNEAGFTQAQFKDWNQGHLATWLSAVWGANTVLANAKDSSGKWAIAPMPQWNATGFATSAWGGSGDMVFSQSKHPKEATEFAIWWSTNQGSIKNLVDDAQLWPAALAGLKNPALAKPYPFFGGQSLAGAFTKASGAIVPGFQWGPAIGFVSTKFGTALTNAYLSKSDFGAALDSLQSQTVAYMKSQGFTVQ